jgi:hypothetical protein
MAAPAMASSPLAAFLRRTAVLEIVLMTISISFSFMPWRRRTRVSENLLATPHRREIAVSLGEWERRATEVFQLSAIVLRS